MAFTLVPCSLAKCPYFSLSSSLCLGRGETSLPVASVCRHHATAEPKLDRQASGSEFQGTFRLASLSHRAGSFFHCLLPPRSRGDSSFGGGEPRTAKMHPGPCAHYLGAGLPNPPGGSRPPFAADRGRGGGDRGGGKAKGAGPGTRYVSREPL